MEEKKNSQVQALDDAIENVVEGWCEIIYGKSLPNGKHVNCLTAYVLLDFKGDKLKRFGYTVKQTEGLYCGRGLVGYDVYDAYDASEKRSYNRGFKQREIN